MNFSEQVAIITGGASGIGLAIARRLKSQGARIVIFDRDGVARSRLADELDESMTLLEIDVTDEPAVQDAVQQVAEGHGRVDILVNSAGVTGATGIITHDVDSDDFKQVLRVNVMSPFFTSKAVLPYMLKRGYGRILHIASIAGKDGNSGMLAYSASKAGLIGMTKVQGKDYAESGITVNALAPAVVLSPMVEAMPEAQVKYMTDRIPMKRCGTLEEVAAMSAFIVSPEASFTTGFTFDITGGRAVY